MDSEKWHSSMVFTPELTNKYTKLLGNKNFSLNSRTMSKGEKIAFEEHSDKIQLVHIILGKLRVTRTKAMNSGLPRETREFSEGDYFYIESGLFHEIVCVESSLFTSTYIKTN